MLSQIVDFFYSKPHRISQPGRIMVQIGGYLFGLGVAGKAMALFLTAVQSLAQQPQTAMSLSEIYPTLPLWWLPETPFGFIGAGLLIVTGACLAMYGKQVDRIFGIR